MRIGFIITLVWLGLLVGGVLLQIFLSRRESHWPGLVLPALPFLYSLAMALGVAVSDGAFPWGPMLASLAMGNIPTVVLLASYAAGRERLKKRREIDKMQIDDL